MLLQTFLEPVHLLQTIVLALSIFNLVAFLWLAITVWLNGDRRAGIARLGVVGLGLSALFFFIHALLISNPLNQTTGFITQDFLWHLIWLPALGVPYIWFAIGLHYAALINEGWRKRRPLLLVISGVLGCIVLLLLVLNQSTFTFAGTLRMLNVGAQFIAPTCNLTNQQQGVIYCAPALPLVLVPILFLCYVTFCAIGPWFTLGRVSRLIRVLWYGFTRGRVRPRPYRVAPGRATQASPPPSPATPAPTGEGPTLRDELVNAFWDDPTDVELLEEPVLSWHLARPGLLLAALLMASLTTTLGILVIHSIVSWLAYGQQDHIPGSPLPSSSGGVPLANILPFNLIVLDLSATGAVALVILLIGYSIVRHGILIERPLARRGFLEQWRGIVIVATAVAIFIALLVSFTHSNLGGLLVITSLATAAYALFTWSSYTAHDRFIALLRPFVRSSSVRHWLNTDLKKTEQDLQDVFFHLCHDVLAVECAYLTVVAGTVRRSFSYRWPVGAQLIALKKSHNDRLGSLNGAVKATPTRVQITLHGQPMICWVLPIYDVRGLVATLYLGPRQDGGTFTDEDMNLAHACGQRILDTLGNHEAMQAVAGLLRRRIVDVKLLDAQQRRMLHDEILPQMHLALLRLETLRSLPVAEQRSPDLPGEVSSSLQATGSQICREQVLDEAVEMISDAHRRLAAMMRATTPGAPHRLAHDGMMNAIHTMLEQDFQNAFDEVEWCVSDESAARIDEVIPPAIAELIFAAVQEALRNAARHARGSDVHRRLRLVLKASWHAEDPYLEVIVADDGVGITSASSSTTGTGGGLMTHSALLAIAGGSLTIKSTPGEGVTLRILIPSEVLR